MSGYLHELDNIADQKCDHNQHYIFDPQVSSPLSIPQPDLTVDSSNPIVLAILKSSGGQPQYVAADGTLTNDSTLAVDFIINPTGQLMGAGGYISTDGNETSATFGVSPTVGPISTVFSLVSNDTLGQRDETASAKILVWRNRAFIGGEAIFCIFGSILEVAFGGEAPAGCIEVELGELGENRELDIWPTSDDN